MQDKHAAAIKTIDKRHADEIKHMEMVQKTERNLIAAKALEDRMALEQRLTLHMDTSFKIVEESRSRAQDIEVSFLINLSD